MPGSGEFKYEDYRGWLTGGIFSVDLLVPAVDSRGWGFRSLLLGQVPPLGVIVDFVTHVGGKEFADLLDAHPEEFRTFLIDNMPRRMSTVGVIVMYGGATQSASGEIKFEGVFRRPTMEDYAALDKLTAVVDDYTEKAILEH